MALIDRKVNDWSQAVSSLDDKPKMTAAALKAAFDSNSNQLKPAINGIIDDLTGSQGALNIGLTPIDGLSGGNVQSVLQAISLLIKSNDVDLESLERLFTTDGAALVGLQPVNGVSGGNLQQAIISLADTISKVDPYLGNPVAISQGGTGAKNIQEALYNLCCGVRPNLLDNWYFIGGGSQLGDNKFPINQKEKKQYNDGNAFDRYKLYNATLLTLNDGSKAQGISVFIDNFGGIFVQIPSFELEVGSVYTLSVLANSVSSTCSIGVYDGGETPMKNGLTVHTFTALPNIQTGGIFLLRKYLDQEQQASAFIYAAKLEKGFGQTLAYPVKDGTGIGGTGWALFEKPNYSIELLKCQRCYQVYSSPELRPAKAIDCRPVMRIDPSQTTIQIDGVTYYVNDANL